MANLTTRWKIWVDTGGTFTDCVAQSPDGTTHRIKVLSTGAIRGRIMPVTDARTLYVAFTPEIAPSLLVGYTLRLLPASPRTYQIVQVDEPTGRITLDSPIADTVPLPTGVEVTAHEEAPILAARLITATPLPSPLPPMEMRLGSTKGTNALLERKGGRVGLLITRGFADLLEIGTQQRPDLFALHIEKLPGLYTQVIEVHERVTATGEILEPLTDEEVNRIMETAKRANVDAWAVALLHSYRNPVHEQILQSRLQAAGVKSISLSSELMPAIKVVPRAETAVVNAYLSPVISRYLQGVQEKLAGSALRIMTSAGGLVSASFFTPKDSLLSGPAGGIVGAAAVARRSGITKILTLDMGGTSTDVARYDNGFDYRYALRVGQAHLQSPALAIETVAAGGGSVCAFDGTKYTVGPESAGAQPGPASYGVGGPLTITDVNLLLGRADPEQFGIPLNQTAAKHALEDLLARTKNEDTDAVLAGFLRIANERMAEAIRRISIRKGYDPSEYTLLAFGGAGGQHACQVAELLQINQILIPPDAGLLSAYGMGQAAVERFATRQILHPLAGIQIELPRIFDRLAREATDQLVMEGFTAAETEIQRQSLFVRFAGQDASIEIPYVANEPVLPAFREKYESVYGHWIDGRQLEIESAKVIVATRKSVPSVPKPIKTTYVPVAYKHQRSYVRDGWQPIPVFPWEMVRNGARITGPALIVSRTSTTFIDEGWTFRTDAAGNGILTRQNQAGASPLIHTDASSEAVQLALFTNRFTAIAEEMGALLERTAFSVNVKERLDFSCAVLDANGYLVVNAPHIPVHLGSLGICVRRVMEALPMEPGDVVITNHPGFGGSHLPDITLISPVHADSGERVGFVANRAHHAEIGGTRPGSMPPDARTLAEEGAIIPPMYLIRNGVAQWEFIAAVFTSAVYPTRALNENVADLRAALAAIHAGKSALQVLCRTYGTERVTNYMQRLKQYAADTLRQHRTKIPSGKYAAEEKLDDGSRLCVQWEIHPEKIRIRFDGTSPTHPGNRNATPAIVTSAVMYVLRLLVNENVPLNEGLLDAVDLHIPSGMLNPHFPDNPTECPAVVGGNTETSQRLVDTLLKALGVAASSQGTMNNVVFGNDTFGYYETIGGGTGAGNGFDGASAVHQHMTNTRITDPEVMEFRYPVRLKRFAIRRDSGGNGRWRGGDGIIREIEFLQPVSVTVLAEHRKTAPYGMAGGEPGSPGRQSVIRANGTPELMPDSGGVELAPGDRIVIETPGGGGYGKAE